MCLSNKLADLQLKCLVARHHTALIVEDNHEVNHTLEAKDILRVGRNLMDNPRANHNLVVDHKLKASHNPEVRRILVVDHKLKAGHSLEVDHMPMAIRSLMADHMLKASHNPKVRRILEDILKLKAGHNLKATHEVMRIIKAAIANIQLEHCTFMILVY